MPGKRIALWLLVLALLPIRALASSPEQQWAGDGSLARGARLYITVTAVGDITIGADPRRTGATNGSQQQYQQAYVQAEGRMLREAEGYFTRENEITLVNLESSFTTSKLYKKLQKAYTFRADPQYAEILSEAGVDVVGHANNHSRDYVTGIEDTREAVLNQGMEYIGNGSTAIVVKNGVRVGFCAFNAVQSFSAARIKKTIRALDRACDLVVVSMHWGKEYRYSASDKMRKLGQMAVSAGADLVAGHHSHVVSGVEQFEGRYIFYGLGTFSSVVKAPEDRDALLISATFAVDEKSRALVDTKINLHPFQCSFDPDVNDGVPVELKGEDRARVLEKVKSLSAGFEATLPDNCFI